MMMCEEQDAESYTYSLAPAEGERPTCINIMTDPTFGLMCNLDKFLFGNGGFNVVRSMKITDKKYFQQHLLDVDGRFLRDLDYLFAAQYITEAKQVFDDASHFIWRQKPSRNVTVAQTKSCKRVFVGTKRMPLSKTCADRLHTTNAHILRTACNDKTIWHTNVVFTLSAEVARDYSYNSKTVWRYLH